MASIAVRRPGPVAEMSLSAGLSGAAFGVAGVVVGVAVLDAVSGGALRWALAAGSLLSALAVAALGAWHRWRGFSERGAGHAAGFAAVVCALNSVHHLVLTDDPLQTTYLVLTIVGAGAILTSLRWLALVDAVAASGYVPLAVLRLDMHAWSHFAAVLATSIAVAHVLHALRARGLAQLQQLTDALAEQAVRDQLTGLRNRHGLALSAADLAAASSPLGVVCLDVDGFKRINDELGHAVGDAVLVEIAERLTAMAGTADTLVRLGGDEFAVLVPGAEPADVERFGHRLRIRLTGTAGVLALPWTVSVGAAAGTVGAPGDVERLLASADLAMYADKQARRRARERAH